MRALSRTMPKLAKAVLAVVLLCAVLLAQSGYTQPAPLACVMGGVSVDQPTTATPVASCQHCCTSSPCCLLSKTANDTAPHPEPLSNERNSQWDHAPVAVTFTPVPTFDFLAPLQLPRILAKDRIGQPKRDCAPRGAVSCIWLI